jgi:flagellar biosynthesis/type III secretory pathway protein FliH
LFDESGSSQPTDTDWKPLRVQHLDKGANAMDPSLPEVSAPNGFIPLTQGAASSPDSEFVMLFSDDSAQDSSPPVSSPAPVPPPVQSDPRKIEQQAYEKGFLEGQKAGMAEGRQRSEALSDRLQTVVEEIEGLWANLVQTYEEQIIALIARAAEKVVYAQVQLDTEVAMRAIRHAFELIPEPVDVTVYVHPEDYEHIETVKADLFEQVKNFNLISIISDPSVGRGGCRVSTRLGEVDGDIESRIETMKTALIDAGRRTSPDKKRNGDAQL